MKTNPQDSKKRRVEPPRLVKGDRPHIVFYAPSRETGRRVRVRIYAPSSELRPHSLSRWRYRTIGTVQRLLEAGYTYAKGTPGPLPMVSPSGEPYDPAPPPRVPQVPAGLVQALEWAHRSKALEVRPRTAETYKTVIMHVRDFLAEAGLQDLRAEELTKAHVSALSDRMLRQKIRGVTRNNYFQTLRALYNRMREAGLTAPNPFSAFRRVPEQRTGQNTAIRRDHAEKLLAWMGKNDPALLVVVRLVYWTFCRPIEAARLRVSDVDPACEVVFFRSEVSKTRRAGAVPLPPDGTAMLRAYLRRAPDSPGSFHLLSSSGLPSKSQAGENTFSSWHRRALSKCGLEGFGYNLYSWKHSGVCAAFDAGMSLPEIRDRCRHSSIQQTEEYLRDLRRVAKTPPPSSW